jgi:hypothetical protein
MGVKKSSLHDMNYVILMNIILFSEMLRASLNLKIKNTRFGINLDELTQSDFKMIALNYCQQVCLDISSISNA